VYQEVKTYHITTTIMHARQLVMQQYRICNKAM